MKRKIGQKRRKIDFNAIFLIFISMTYYELLMENQSSTLIMTSEMRRQRNICQARRNEQQRRTLVRKTLLFDFCVNKINDNNRKTKQ